jgi:hypothetical protein
MKYEFFRSFQILPNIVFVPEERGWLIVLPFYGTIGIQKH